MNEDLPNNNIKLLPTLHDLAVYHPDPDLCLTPDVRIKPKTRKVRFNDVRQSLEFDDSRNSDNQDIVIKDRTCAVKNAVKNRNNSNYIPQRYMESVEPKTISKYDENYTEKISYKYIIPELEQSLADSSQVCQQNYTDIVEVLPQVDYNSNQQNNGIEIFVDQEGSSKRAPNNYSYPFTDINETVGELEYCAFSKPEFNSSLRIGEEIIALKATKPDVVKAVTDKMKISEPLRTVISEKASSRVNCTTSQYNDLVSVEVSEDSIHEIDLRQKPIRIPRPTKATIQPSSKFQDPDIMTFFTDDLQIETVDLSLDGLGVTFPDDGPTKADLTSCFNIYRHNSAWEGW